MSQDRLTLYVILCPVFVVVLFVLDTVLTVTSPDRMEQLEIWGQKMARRIQEAGADPRPKLTWEIAGFAVSAAVGLLLLWPFVTVWWIWTVVHADTFFMKLFRAAADRYKL